MQPVTVHIAEDGTIRFLVNEDSKPFLTEDAVVRRASHVEPVQVILRLLFHGLRFTFGEKGRMSNFTRLWPCEWRINLAPTNGPILPETYRDRQQAIEAEVRYLNENFL